MKKISAKILAISVIVLAPITVFAQSNIVNPTELVKQMQSLLSQYNERIRALEAENQLLRNLMAKHEIQIPLEDYTKLMASTGTITAAPTLNSANSATGTTVDLTKQPAKNTAVTASVTPLQKGFIDQINKDWAGIRGAYQFPENAWIGGYEFVKSAAGNNVFVDIVYGGGTPEGAYNAKLLYEFDKTTFKRKLIGLFIYNSESKGYVTKTGSNPFAGVERDIIRGTTVNNSTPTLNSAPSTTSTTTTPAATTNSASATETENKLTALYQAKNYSGVISTSDAYLKSNSPTYKILQLRYRSLFVLRQFTKALDEVQKMESAGLATPFSYCEAYAIAMHANNSTLAAKYKKAAGSGCSTTGS